MHGWDLEVSILLQGGVVVDLRPASRHHYFQVFFNDVECPERNRSLILLPSIQDKIYSSRDVHPPQSAATFNVYMSRSDDLGGALETVELLGGTVERTIHAIEQAMDVFLRGRGGICQPLHIVS